MRDVRRHLAADLSNDLIQQQDPLQPRLTEETADSVGNFSLSACHGKGIAMQSESLGLIWSNGWKLRFSAAAAIAVAVACGTLARVMFADDGLPELVRADGSIVADPASAPDSAAPASDPASQTAEAAAPAEDDASAAGANEREPAAANPFAAEIQSARDAFQPISDDQLSAARTELDERMRALERFVGASSDNGKKWLKFLRWQPLEEALDADGLPALDPLATTYRQLNRNKNGLELQPFRRLARVLRNYLDLVAVARLDDPASAYGQQLDALAADLERYRTNPTPKDELTIGARLDFLAGVGQADELVQAVRGEFSRPNAYLQFSEALLGAAVGEPIDRSEFVTDCILGTRFRGMAHTTGTVSVRTVPSDESARLELISDGRSVGDNTGRNGPAVICTTSFTDFNAAKLVELSDDEFRTHPAWASADTSSQIHSVRKAGGGLGSMLVSRIGSQQARQRQGQSNAIAADHAEDRIVRRMNDEVGREIRDARRRYEEEYRRPLARRGELPQSIQFSTTDDAMHVVVTQANRAQLGAPNDPPPLPNASDLVAALHSTAVNNYAAIILGGATISETEPGQEAKIDVEVPDWMREAWEGGKAVLDSADSTDDAGADDSESFKPYSLTFRRGRPITVDFADGAVKLTIHVAKLASGDDQFENWDISGTFTPELKEGGVVLHRQGDLVVLPSGFDPEHGQLSSRQVGIRSNLTKVLNERSAQGRGFPHTIEIERLKPRDRFERIGPLDLKEFASGDGWLTLAWDRN